MPLKPVIVLAVLALVSLPPFQPGRELVRSLSWLDVKPEVCGGGRGGPILLVDLEDTSMEGY
jgi:hypothetical protein